MTDYIYELDFKVRDYECDAQGIVNNSVYQNYYEHTRHEFFKLYGYNFTELSKQDIKPVVYRVEIDYKHSLIADDEFTVKLNVGTEGNLKTIYHQAIYRKSDNQLLSKAKITVVVVENGKVVRPNILTDPIKDKLI